VAGSPICGPTEMTDPTLQMLRNLGVPDKAIQVEAFKSPSRAASTSGAAPKEHAKATATPAPAAGDGGAATVTFARSGKSAAVSGRQTVLEAAEALGVRINYECRAGICGQCKTRLLAGRVHMEAEDALNALDRANNLILSCQARCIDQVVVEA
jgi:ferredoxin